MIIQIRYALAVRLYGWMLAVMPNGQLKDALCTGVNREFEKLKLQRAST